MTSMPTATTGTWTIVVAAGQGRRFRSDVPKQFTEVAGRRIVDHSTQAAASVSEGVVVVMPEGGEFAPPEVPAAPLAPKVIAVPGGSTRSESVRCGLAAIDQAEIVLVHDAARPLASPELFARVVEAVRSGADAVVPVVPVVDTLRDVEGRPVDRSKLVAVQTPQGFSAAALRQAHRDAAEATDDATLVTELGGHVVTVPGERWNLKVTDRGDELIAEALLGAPA